MRDVVVNLSVKIATGYKIQFMGTVREGRNNNYPTNLVSQPDFPVPLEVSNLVSRPAGLKSRAYSLPSTVANLTPSA